MFRPMFHTFALIFALATPAVAQGAAMAPERLTDIILAIDPDAAINASGIELTIEGIQVLVVMAPGADRMRAMVPIASVEDVTPEEMNRMMQANFDTALDARYAVAQGHVWGVFIHPLGALEREEFLSGLAQTVNLARTFDTLYSGGAQVFGGGYSNGIYNELFGDLLNRGQEI